MWIGSLTGLILAFGAVGQYSGGTVSDYLKTKAHGLFFILVASVPLLFGIGLVQGIPQLALCGLLSVLIFTFQPIQNHLIADLTKKHRRGVAYGISYGLFFGFGAFAAPLGGWVIDQAGVHLVYLLLGGVAMLAAAAMGVQLLLTKRVTMPTLEPSLTLLPAEPALKTQ